MRRHTLVVSLLIALVPSLALAMDMVLGLDKPVAGARWGDESPTTHPRYFKNTQWAVDVYGGEGSPVVARGGPEAYPFYLGYQGQVVDVGTVTCSDGSTAGQYVMVDLYPSSTSTTKVGRLTFSHLASVPDGGSFRQRFDMFSGRTVGYLHQWPNVSCYQVPSASGIHVHMEWGGFAPLTSNWNSPDYKPSKAISYRLGWIYRP